MIPASKDIRNIIASMILEDNKKKYYIGKIIMDTANVNPATYLGFGTWTLWGSGRVPVGVDLDDTDFNEVEKTGGEKTHTLTVDEMPSHNHPFPISGGTETGSYIDYQYGEGKRTYSGTDIVGAYGGNMPHNNMQPYITCYMWKRTA